MVQATDGRISSVLQIVAICTLIVVGYLCTRCLRFTHAGLNLLFASALFLLPFLALWPVMRLHRWPKVVTTILLSPLLLVSLSCLIFTVACEVPALIHHREFSRELSIVRQEKYSIHLLWEETAGGAVGPHGLVLEQRRFIVPGLYVVKQLDYFEGAYEGSLSLEGTDRVSLHVPKRDGQPEIDKVYLLKRNVFF